MTASSFSPFPAELRDWAGHREGGVRRLLHAVGGRPSGFVINTALLSKMVGWAGVVARDADGAPRTVLLLGAPGNGKTEAVEATLGALDEAMEAAGSLIAYLRPLCVPVHGFPQRAVSVQLSRFSTGSFTQRSLTVVQDASVADASANGLRPAELLVEDLRKQLSADAGLYLACVNRGVLDDALILAEQAKEDSIKQLFRSIVAAVGIAPAAPSCWPLQGYPDIAIWPMDVESLTLPLEDGGTAPAAQVLNAAILESSWPAEGACSAGDRCPYCTSKSLLKQEQFRMALLEILRLFEYASGKRWTFRDLFSLVSYLLAGVAVEGETSTPCEEAATLVALDAKPVGTRRDMRQLRAPFQLVAAQYQHALFSRWPRAVGRAMRADLRDLKLEDPTLLGLSSFLSASAKSSLPATLALQLDALVDVLDPALADPDSEIAVSSQTVLTLRDIDSRFSHSVGEGLKAIRRYKCLSRNEVILLERLAKADELLSGSEIRRRRPKTATRVQLLVRDFACRTVRRSLGCRAAVVRDGAILDDYQHVIEGDQQLLHEAVKRVESLLNDASNRFVVSLNTTFGESLPPPSRRATLLTPRQKVRPLLQQPTGRPKASIQFLSIGTATSNHVVSLTYELFRSVRQLSSGMLEASLPRTVIALLDATRARLAGRIVRDEDQLDGAEIELGIRNERIVRELQGFHARSMGE
jgi:hypothetical protein